MSPTTDTTPIAMETEVTDDWKVTTDRPVSGRVLGDTAMEAPFDPPLEADLNPGTYAIIDRVVDQRGRWTVYLAIISTLTGEELSFEVDGDDLEDAVPEARESNARLEAQIEEAARQAQEWEDRQAALHDQAAAGFDW